MVFFRGDFRTTVSQAQGLRAAMSGFLDSQTIDLQCATCGRRVNVTVGWANAHRQLACTCGAVTMFKTDRFRRGMARTNAELKKIDNAIAFADKRRRRTV